MYIVSGSTVYGNHNCQVIQVTRDLLNPQSLGWSPFIFDFGSLKISIPKRSQKIARWKCTVSMYCINIYIYIYVYWGFAQALVKKTG